MTMAEQEQELPKVLTPAGVIALADELRTWLEENPVPDQPFDDLDHALIRLDQQLDQHLRENAIAAGWKPA